MLDSLTKKKIDDARDILVGKVPVPQAQVEQITIALIYKFMYDMDNESISLGGNPKYFTGDYAQYAWNKVLDKKLSGDGRVLLYQTALTEMPKNGSIPQLFRDIFKNAFLPYRDPETLYLFLKCIDEFTYDHSERLGDAFEYLLAILGSQGDAGQFRTPRHIIDFIVALVDPQKEDVILDPACGTAGFLISGYKHILKNNSSNYDPQTDKHTFEESNIPLNELIVNGKKYRGDKLSPDQMAFLHNNIKGYDISFDMVRLSLVNMYLHGFSTPHIYEYDTLTNDTRWGEHSNVILANPPFMTPKGGIKPHTRFSIQAKRSEVLFVDYIMEHLTANGRAGIIVPEGIIFQSGNAYKQLRKTLVDSNYLVGVISLPAGVFNPYSGVKTSILWLDKSLAKKTDLIIFLKVNADGYDPGAQRRPIDKNDLPAVYAHAMAYKEAVLTGKEFQLPEKDLILVDKAKLRIGDDYNLNGDRYLIQVNVASGISKLKLGEIMKSVGTVDPQKNSDEVFELWSIPAFDKGAPEVLSGKEIGSQKKLVSPGDVLLSRIVPHIRRAWVVTQNILGIRQIASTEWIVFSGDRVDPRFLSYMLVSDSFHAQFMLTVTGVGGSLSRASIDAVRSLEVPLPPLSVQEEIVAELDSYQKIIDGAKQVVDNWKPRIDIDPQWPTRRIQEVVVLNPSKREIDSLSLETEVSFVPMSDLGTNRISFQPESSKQLTEVLAGSYTYFKDNDVILAKVTPCFENGKAGIAKNLVNGFGFGSSEYYVLRCSDDILPEWLFMILTGNAFRSLAIANMTGTGGLQRIPKTFIQEYKIPVPSLSTQRNICKSILQEHSLVSINYELIIVHEQKIKNRIDRLWRNK